MTYARRMTPEMNLHIGHFVEKVEALQPSQSILIRATDPKHLNTVRNHFYSWCHLFNKKSLYRTYKESATTLRILRTETKPVEVIQDVPLSRTEEIVRDYLLDCEDEGEARDKIQVLLGRELITEDDVMPILLEFNRIQGD